MAYWARRQTRGAVRQLTQGTDMKATTASLRILVTLILVAVFANFAAAAKVDTIIDAAWRGDLKAVQAFVAQGVPVDSPSLIDGSTALYASAARDSLEVAQYLIEHGADLNARTPEGDTPLHQAAYSDSLRLATLLISKGADINAIDLRGRTPLHMAAGSYIKLDPQLIDYLLAKGARINARDLEGNTPLHAVVAHVRTADFSTEQLIEKIAKIFLEHGADTEIKNNDGETACKIATASHNFVLCLLLIPGSKQK
jgi:ankyrin repeat protein